MPSYFANPFGFLALLAIPAIIFIHLLRERSRRVPVSTLFLLERLAPQTPKGWRIHFLQNSLPLWLQLLIALLCTWLLVQPRWLRNDSRQKVTVILDNTASMSAFRPQILAELPHALEAVSHAAAHTDWTVLATDVPETPLYRGTELRDALAILDQWHPALPHHDPARAFSLSLLDLRAGGTILFVSDHQPEALPSGVTLLAFGHPIANCGFAGEKTWTDADGPQWEVLIRNSSDTAQERQWWIETEKVRSQPQKLTLAPGQIVSIPGAFPPGEKKITVHLTPDEFALDDMLPLVAPEPKKLSLFVHAGPVASRFAERVIKILPGTDKTAAAMAADVALVGVADEAALPPSQSAVVLGVPGEAGAKLSVGGFTAERHSFTDGLIWDGLLSTGAGALKPETSDLTLLWQSGKPIVFLRSQGTMRRLYLNFDFEGSNADRLPASVLLTARFLKSIQQGKSEHFADNFETNQALPSFPAKAELALGAKAVRSREGEEMRAPVEPGFFQVREEGRELLDAAAHFGDPREADFRLALSTPAALSRTALVRQENTVSDPLAALWLLMVGAALAGSWGVRK